MHGSSCSSRTWHVVVFVAVALVAGGCGRARPTVSLADPVIDFGASRPGGGVERELRVIVEGGGDAAIDSVEILGEGFLASEREPPSPLERTLFFHPLREGLFSGEAVVAVVADGEHLELRADLRGASTEASACGEDPCVATACTPAVFGYCSWTEADGNRCAMPDPPCAWLTWDPTSMNFGYATPGTEVRRTLTFFNHSPKVITLTGTYDGSSELWIQYEPDQGPNHVTIPPATRNGSGAWQPGTATLRIVARPAEPGPRYIVLTFLAVSHGMSALLTIPIRIYGGGPDILVNPWPTMHFGKVAWFEGTPTHIRKSLLVINMGTEPNPPDPAGNLLLGAIEVTPLNANTAADEFRIEVPSTYDTAVGLVAKAGLNTVALPLTFTPSSAGLKEARVTIRSNDPDEPTVNVNVSASAVVLPDCNYQVSPSSIDASLSPPDYRDVGITISNLGTGPGDVCLLYGLEFSADSAPNFSLPNGPLESTEIGPGESTQRLLRVWPSSSGTATGSLIVRMSSATRPQTTIPLRIGP